MNGFLSISEKGVVFNSGLDVQAEYNSGVATFVYPNLQGTSNTGSFLQDNTMGYDISSPRAVSVNDSVCSFQIGNENGASIEKQNITSVNSEPFDIVNVNEKTEGLTTLTVAPIFPVVLGRLNSNTSDNRGNCNMYLINNIINSGGFIHRLEDSPSLTNYLRPKDTIRYWDLQTFKQGTLTKTFDSIYNIGAPIDFNIKVELDLSKKDKIGSFASILDYISDMINNEGLGKYELDPATIEVKNIVNISKQHVNTNNPPFDHSLIKVN